MSFFLQLKDSITLPKFYSHIYKQRFSKTFKYLFLFFLLTFIVSGTIFSFKFLNGVDRFNSEIQSQVPDFVLANGKLQVHGPQPIIFDSGSSKFVVDTTGKITEQSLSSEPGDYVLVTETQVVVMQGFRRNVFKFSDMPIEFNKDMLMQKLPYLKLLLILIGVFAFIFGLIGRLFWALVLSLGALVIDASLKTKLKYAQLYNVCVYALTLPIIIELIKDYAMPKFPLFSLVYWGVGLVYVYLALKAIKDEEFIEPTDSNLTIQ